MVYKSGRGGLATILCYLCMKSKMAKVLSFLFVLMVVYNGCEGLGKKLLISNVVKCPVASPVDMDFKLYKNDLGELTLDLQSDYDYDIDDTYRMQFSSEVYRNDWVPHLGLEDTWCKFLEAFGRPWNLAKEMVKPPLLDQPDPCLIPADKYVLEKFQVDHADTVAVIQGMDAAKYRANVTLFIDDGDGKKEELLCVAAEFEIAE